MFGLVSQTSSAGRFIDGLCHTYRSSHVLVEEWLKSSNLSCATGVASQVEAIKMLTIHTLSNLSRPYLAIIPLRYGMEAVTSS